MKKIVFLLLFLSVPPIAAFAASFSGTTPQGGNATVTFAVQKAQTPSGKSKLLLLNGTWSGFVGTGVVNGFLYSFAWNDYVSDSTTGELYENDPAHGAFFVLAFAYESNNPACKGGASFYMVMEMPGATNITDLGDQLNASPLFGQICGTKITKLETYSLSNQ